MSTPANTALLVPMGLKAMVMPQNDGTQGWDRRVMEFGNLNRYASPTPQVFGNEGGTDGTPPGVGVHLYWTLPRALSTALSSQDVETANATVPGTYTGANTPYPLIPNRWLVVRIAQGGEGESPTAVAWVLSSDEEVSRGQVVNYVNPNEVSAGNVVNPIQIGIARALSDWQAAQPISTPAPYLTAVGPADATFSAFTPGTQNILSFYDPMGGEDGIGSGNFSYSVIGWYSTPEADPINPANPVNGTSVDWQVVSDANAPSDAPALSTIARLGWTAPLDDTPAPTQTLTHALLRDVAWSRTETLPDPAQFSDYTTATKAVKVAFANASAEGISALAYSAMVAGGTAPSDAAKKALELEALQYRSLRSLDQPSGVHLLEDRIKRASYATSDGGYIWEVVAINKDDLDALILTQSQAQALAQLNQNQRALDEARDVLASMQLRLYSLWWQQQAIVYASTPGTAPYQNQFQTAKTLLSVPNGETLSAPVVDYMTQVSAQAQTVADLQALVPSTDSENNVAAVAAYAALFLDPKRQTLKAIARPGFFGPTDPVFVISGAGRLSDPQPNQVLCRLGGSLAAAAGWETGDSIPDAAAALAAEAEGFVASHDALEGALFDHKWEQPWAPLYLDWQLQYYYTYKPGLSDDNVAIDRQGNYKPDQAAWSFDGRAERYVGGPYSTTNEGPLEDGFAKTYSGRTYLAPHGARNFHAQLAQLAAETGVDFAEADLSKILDWSLLSQTASGVTDLLNMRDTSANVGPNADIAGAVGLQASGVPAPSLKPLPLLQGTDTGTPYFFPMRAGFWSIKGLRLTDSFGRTMDLMSANGGNVGAHDPSLHAVLPPAMVPPAGTDTANLGLAASPPRLIQASRLAARFVDGSDDRVESDLNAGANPICGWLLPNHADRSLAVYDTDGLALGALQPFVQSDGTSLLQWLPAPGGSTAPGVGVAAPDIANPNLSALVTDILARSDGAAALSDMMQTLDQSSWTLDPGEDRAAPGRAALVGYPVAVVRMNLQLQLKGLANTDQSYEKIFSDANGTLAFDTAGVEDLTFQMRLGAQELRRDGVAGYFLGSDYTQLNAVARPTEASTDYVAQAGQGGAPYPGLSPVQTPLGSGGQMDSAASLWATLLVDPRGDIHVTSGILPRVQRSLPPQAVVGALSNMALSMQVGPVLVDPNAVRLPKPAGANGTWSWLSATRPDASGWQVDPFTPADGTARPMAMAPRLQQGWMVLDPSGPQDDPGES